MKTITGRWNKDKHLKDNPEEDLTVKTSQFYKSDSLIVSVLNHIKPELDI